MIRCNEEEIALLLASLVDLSNSFVSGSYTNDSSLINTSVSNHIRGGEVVHNKLEFAFFYPFRDLLRHTCSTHLGCFVIGCNAFVRWNKILLIISCLKRKYLFHASVEEKCDMGI